MESDEFYILFPHPGPMVLNAPGGNGAAPDGEEPACTCKGCTALVEGGEVGDDFKSGSLSRDNSQLLQLRY